MIQPSIQRQRRTFLALTGHIALAAGYAPLVWAAGATPRIGRPKTKVLLDTDIGSDIDDAVALAYLVMQPEINLLGITTATGESVKRAALARQITRQVGLDIPVIPGIEPPRVIAQRQLVAQQAVELPLATRQTLPRDHNPEAAIDFMANAIQSNPGEITLLAVGPFTNVARLLEREPGISKLLHEIVIMGGKYSDYPTPWGPTEWNAIVDPHATSMLFQLAECPIRALGLDITWRLFMTPEKVRSEFKAHPLLQTVLAWSEVWFKERDLLHFHDPLAAACIVSPDLCTYSRGNVQVDLSSSKTAGITTFTPDPNGPVKIAIGVDPDRFFSTFFKAFSIATRI
jgi:purine nucleosidase